LLSGEPGLCPCGCVGVRRKGSFVEKTLTAGADLLRQVMFADDVASQRGWLQRVDPRVKIAGLLALLVAAAFARHIETLAAMYAATLLLAASSRLPLGFFVKRVWLFVPLFTVVVVAPATLSVVTPGEIVLQLWTWQGTPHGLTAPGLYSAGLVVSRVAVSISLVALLTLTTPWNRLLAALRALGVPRMFVMITAMAYRFVFLLLGTLTQMYEARKARSLGRQAHDRAAREFVSASAGALFGKAHHLSEEVHQAMVARGYRGDATTLDDLRTGAVDAVFAAGVVVAVSLALGGDRFLVH
jgi:cobalt ECF transporter T component CbiQ